MAGPSVAVRILGDLSGWSNSINGAGDTAQSGASRIKGAFSGVLGQLNATGVLGPFSGAISAVSSSMESLSDKTGTLGTKMIGAGGAVLGLGVGLQTLGSKQQAAQQQLSAAITATGGSYSDYTDQITEAIGAEEHHGDTAAETMTAMQKLTQIMHDPAEAIKTLGVASDVAASKHEDLVTAAGQVGKAYEGQTRILKEFGITAKVSGTDALTELAGVTAGQASAAADTFSGKLTAMKTHLEDNVTTFATQYGPAITAGGAALTGLGATIEIVKGAQDLMHDSTILSTIATDAQAVSAGVVTAAQWLWNAALEANPIGVIVLALVALGAAFYEAYQHVGVFRTGITDLWTGIKTAFGAIKQVIGDVFDWLKTNWPLVLGILTGPFGLILEQIVTHWADVTTFLEGLPADIKNLFKDAATWLEQAGADIVKGLVKGVTGAVDSVGKAVGSIASKVKHAFTNPLSLLSPSKVFEDYGRNVVQGFVNGINNAAPAAAGAVGSMAAGVAGAGASSGGTLVSMGDVHISSPVDLDLLTQKISGALLAGRV